VKKAFEKVVHFWFLFIMMNVCQLLVERQLGGSNAPAGSQLPPRRRIVTRTDARIMRQLLLSNGRSFCIDNSAIGDGRPWKAGHLMFEQGKVFVRTALNIGGAGGGSGGGELLCYQVNPAPPTVHTQRMRPKAQTNSRATRKKGFLYNIVNE